MSTARDIDRIADEFEAACQAGEHPNIEDFGAKIDEEHRPALHAALMPLDLTYRRKLGETIDSAPVPEGAKAFDVTLDSDTKRPKLSATSASGGKDRVKYFGEYELLSEIARGGMGVVYKARQVKLNRIVALKMILSGEFAGSEAVQRFHSEAEAAANLDHPGIVPIYEIGEHGGQHYFSMGFIDGPSLQGKLNAGPMPAKEAARLCRKIAEAVAYAHSKNVIHRDLKPANVLLDQNGEPKVTDFGLAKKVEGDSGLTRTGAVMGTPSYMPPEQALGQTDKIGPAADVYSLGAILYCMLTGRPPFQAANVVDTLKQVIENEPITPRTLDLKIPLDLETICLNCLEKNPASRYASTQDFVDELNRFAKGEPIKARRISRTARTVRWCKRRPVVASLASALLIALISGVGVSTYFARAFNIESTNAQQSLARSNIALAAERWRTNDIADSYCFLDNVPKQLRDRRWHKLHDRLQGSSATIFGHADAVTCVALSPGLGFITTGSSDGSIRILDTQDFQVAPLRVGPVSVACLDYYGDDDGTKLVFAGNWPVSDSDQAQRANLIVWDMKTLDHTSIETLHNRIAKVKFFNDGKHVLVTEIGSDWTLHDTNGVKQNFWYQASDGSKSSSGDLFHAVSVASNPDGTQLATGNEDGTICLWDVKSKMLEGKLTGHTGSVNGIAYSPDGRLLVSGSGSRRSVAENQIGTDNSVRVWDVRTKAETKTFVGHTDSVNEVAFNPYGTHVLSCSNDSTIRLIDIHAGNIIATQRYGLENSLGGRMSTASIESFREHVSQDRIYRGHLGAVTGVAFSPDGNRFVSTSTDGSVKLWNIDVDDQLSTYTYAARPIETESTSSWKELSSLSTSGIDDSSANKNYQIRVLRGNTDDNTDIALAVLNADQTLVAGANLKEIRIWDTTSGEIRTVIQHGLEPGREAFDRAKRVGDSGAHCLEFSPTGSNIAASDYGSIKIWDSQSGSLRKVLTSKTGGSHVHHFAFSSDGRLIAGAYDTGVQIWNVHSGTPEKFCEPGIVPSKLMFSADNSIVQRIGGGVAWDVTTGKMVEWPPTEEYSSVHAEAPTDGRNFVVIPVKEYVLLADLDSKYYSNMTLNEDKPKTRLEHHDRQADDSEASNNWFGAMAHRAKQLLEDPESPKAWYGLQLAHARYQADCRQRDGLPIKSNPDGEAINPRYIPHFIRSALAIHLPDTVALGNIDELVASANRCQSQCDWYMATGYYAAALNTDPQNIDAYYGLKMANEQRVHCLECDLDTILPIYVELALNIGVPKFTSTYIQALKNRGSVDGQTLARWRDMCDQLPEPANRLSLAKAIIGREILSSDFNWFNAHSRNYEKTDMSSLFEARSSLEAAISASDIAIRIDALTELAGLLAIIGDVEKAKYYESEMLAAVAQFPPERYAPNRKEVRSRIELISNTMRIVPVDTDYRAKIKVHDSHDNLLSTVDLANNWTLGKWEVRDGLLEGTEKDSVIELPYTPPDEYRITAIVEPLDAPSSLLLGQRSGGYRFLVSLASKDQNSLGIVDGVAVPNETTHRGQLLHQGERAEVVVTVRKETVQVSVDGLQIIDWKGEPSQLSLVNKTPHNEALMIQTVGCRYRIHRLSIEPISGESRVLTKETPKTDDVPSVDSGMREVPKSVSTMLYEKAVPLVANGDPISVETHAATRCFDWDADGDLDLLVGGGDGRLWLYRNNAMNNVANFQRREPIWAGNQKRWGNAFTGCVLANLVGDALPDLVVGYSDNQVSIHRNIGTDQVLKFAEESMTLKVQDGCHGRIDVADWDGDGLQDLITGAYGGRLAWHRNQGTAETPVFGDGESFCDVNVAYNSLPRIVDFNQDGRLDLLLGVNWGSVSVYLNDGTAEKPSVGKSQQTLWQDGSGLGIRELNGDDTTPELADLDGDGVLDLISGGHNGRLFFMKGIRKERVISDNAVDDLFGAPSAK